MPSSWGSAMEITLAKFVKSLADSGLIIADEVEAVIDRLPSANRPKDGAALVRELFKQNRLTNYQAEVILQGETTSLVLGDYVVLHPIGRGGMGQVYKAQHRVMQRVVALKTLPAAATKLKEAVDRFHLEVILAARLCHPNIVTAYDAGESCGIHYLVMEYVDGGNLSSYVKKYERLPVSSALDCVIQAARGLACAHAENIIHHDVKPSNLLVDKHGTVKVLDMGLARLKKTITSSNTPSPQTRTTTSQVMGSIDFMPPEQVESFEEADERSDVYSLGCTFFYLLIGRAMYGGHTTAERLLAHREAKIPSLLDERPDVPEHLDAVFQKMVAKQSKDRHDSMTEVISDLEKFDTTKLAPQVATTDLDDMPFSCDLAETRLVATTEDTPADDFALPDFSLRPEVSPLRKRSKSLHPHGRPDR